MRGHLNETTGEVTITFDPRELDLAIWDCELLANALENAQPKGYDMSKLWDFARQLRALREDKKL